MRFLPQSWILFILLVLLLFGTINCEFVEEFESQNDDVVSKNYDRLDEVNRACSSVIASASVLEQQFDVNGIKMMKNQMSFYNGDWVQLGNAAPLMPFDDRPQMKGFGVGMGYDSYNYSYSKSPYKLASFRLTDVSTAHWSKKTVAVSGYLLLVMTSDYTLATLPRGSELSARKIAEFQMTRGYSQLFVDFQGIYVENKKNDGGRVLCLLGSSLLPSRQPDSNDPWESIKGSDPSDNQPPLLQDDQILLVLNIPKTASLKHRAVRGEMRSLNSKKSLKYFDKVQITSQLQTRSHHYEFGPSEIIAKACDPYPYLDNSVSGGDQLYKGIDFCTALRKLSTDAAFTVAPHWRCNGTDEFCSKFGPFVSDKVINATDGGFNNVKILMQNIFCLANKTLDNGVTAKVFAVFRAFDAPDYQFFGNQRSGLDNMTLVAEGIWKSSSGQLCMIGCLGVIDVTENGCKSRICLYMPMSFSITQRGVLLGSISSVEVDDPPFFPLSLEMYQSMDYFSDSYTDAYPHYQYSKIVAAGVVLEKYEPFSFGTVIKKSLLKFPKLQDSEDYAVSLGLLAEDLTIHDSAVSDPPSSYQTSGTNVELEIVSVGPMFGRYWSSNESAAEKEEPYRMKASYTEKQLLLNVSAQLKLRGGPYSNLSLLFLEGLYDQHVGKMYLIGCRDVRASWNVLYETMDLESGLDCLMEVVISYPPTTARWLVSPTVSISISSQRAEDNPFYFKPVKLITFPILYRQQREDILSQRAFEMILEILSLSAAIACILSQLFDTGYVADSLPYMSLAMLGSQVIGYALPLVTGAGALFGSKYSAATSYDTDKFQWNQVIDYILKLLVLVCFILTLRLCQKVWRSRLRLLSQSPNEPRRLPTEKHVLLISVTIHFLGYILALIFHSVKTGQPPLWTEKFVDATGNPHTLKTWETLFLKYVGLLQDLFLLPQVIGNIMWRINCKPLRKLYYMGVTVVRLLPHIYDYIRGPVANPFFSEEYEFVNRRFDFFSELGDITIPVLAITLAVIVHIQQRWNYEKLNNTLTVVLHRLLPFRSKMYERLPSQSVETELVSGPSKSKVQDTDE